MITIHKYPLLIQATQTVWTRLNACPLTVQMQDGKLCLWCQIDTDDRERSMLVEIFGTGHPLPEAGLHTYIGTVQDSGLVWHVFERNDYLP